jgi:hypothetical protein
MTFTQAQRTEMHQVLREKLTMTAADTLLEHLPPSGWADVATKTDLLLFEERLNANISRAIATQNKWMTGIMASLVIAMVVALVR